MSTIKTTTRHTITMERDKAKYNLINSFVALLKDQCRIEGFEDVEMIEADIDRMTDCLGQINKGNFKDVFGDGYTMMILEPEDFDYVDNFFRKHLRNDEELDIVLTDKEGFTTEIIPHQLLSY
jgi:hypothetical protein